ncbi:HAMP domain-containing methyl-accepting chemotaxis protein [Paludibacterium yongneupense]|uniref:methyl-accepting chemotaxis protein n=1 Tax=Paludibacterium yongneupense TaxID=400061 RepID=UPI00146F27FA
MTLTIALFSMLLVGTYGGWQIGQDQDRLAFVQQKAIPAILQLDIAKGNLANMRIAAYRHLSVTDPAEKQAAESDLATAFAGFNNALAAYEQAAILDETARKLLATERTDVTAYHQVAEKVIGLSRANDTASARAVLANELYPAGERVHKDIVDHFAFIKQQGQVIQEQGTAAYHWSEAVGGILMAAAFLVSALTGFRTYRHIHRSLDDIQSTLEKVGGTLDFTLRARIRRQDEVGQTASSFNSLLERLQHNLGDLLLNAREVATESQQLSQTAVEVSSAAEEESQAAASMAATIEQMTVSINHVASQATLTHEGSVEAAKLVDEGSRIIGQTIADIREISTVIKTSVNSIQELEAYTGQVSAVISVIREVADQTNLLALNAAIEAARAGESGRGFAVVADEVRKLAERTASSTQEIATTIEAMVDRSRHATTQMQSAEQRVESGVERADNADRAIKRIGEHTATSTRSVSEIATAIKQQGEASNNIASEVEHTAALSEESSTAARQTADSAVHLAELAKKQIATLARYTV